VGTRAKQVVTALAGLAVTLAMVWLGLWQAQVFQSKEDASAAQRAALPPRALLDEVRADGTVGDVYGRRVTATGRFGDEQVLVVAADGSTRVVTALVLADGRALPLVRGSLPGPESDVPAAPPGQVAVEGVFLASEAGADHPVPDGTLASLRLPLLAQTWPQQLVPGYVTLDAAASTAQGLGAVVPVLPTGEGSLQNAGYAVQWWVFAGFAALMTVRFVAVIGRRGRLGTLSDEETP
jgi:cytochrome oxidase assembly protein ShyY1